MEPNIDTDHDDMTNDSMQIIHISTDHITNSIFGHFLQTC